MISLKQFRRKPSNTDKQGIPMMISQGGHSLPKKDFSQDEKGMPTLVSQGKHSEPKSSKKPIKEQTDNWNPEYKFNIDPYYADPRLGTSAQKGMERDVSRLDKLTSAHEQVQEKFKLDNHHISGAPPENRPWYHYTSHHEYLTDAYGRYKNSLHPEIFRYTEGSETLNRRLWEDHMNGYESPEMISDHHVGDLDKALNSKKLPTKLTVYSGVKMNPGLYAGRNSYNRIFLPAYTSTSIDPGVAFSFSAGLRRGTESDQTYGQGSTDRHMIRMHLPEGHPGEYIGKRSAFDSESEFLLPRKTSLQLMPNPTILKFADRYKGRLSTSHLHVWDAHPVKP